MRWSFGEVERWLDVRLLGDCGGVVSGDMLSGSAIKTAIQLSAMDRAGIASCHGTPHA